jgi:F-type H+-transporting ATPase subunit 8
MNSTRFFRPLARAAFRQPTAIRPAVMARPALAASQSQAQKTEAAPQQMVRTRPGRAGSGGSANGDR